MEFTRFGAHFFTHVTLESSVELLKKDIFLIKIGIRYVMPEMGSAVSKVVTVELWESFTGTQKNRQMCE